jgi:hypothetical protein
MRRELHWKTKRDDGTFYEVRVGFFGGEFKFQYKENGEPQWDYKRTPTREDLEMLLGHIERRAQRRRAGQEQVIEAKKLLREFRA